jgi:hypothetical protein
MPERQCDGRVVAMTHRPARVNARVALHHSPTPTDGVWISLDDGAILVRRNAVRIPVAHVNHFAATTEDFFHEVRFAATTTERLVAENEFFIHCERRFRHEEPFTLTAKCAVLTRVTFAERNVIACERVTNVLSRNDSD